LVWHPGPDDLGQNAWTYPHYDITHKKNKTITFPIFEKIWTTRLSSSLEGLNSSLTLSAGKLWLCKVQQKIGTRETTKKWCTWDYKKVVHVRLKGLNWETERVHWNLRQKLVWRLFKRNKISTEDCYFVSFE